MEISARRKKTLYPPPAEAPFRLSRSKIDLFVNCRRCFYLDRRFGLACPGGLPFTLNSAVDALLKREFDTYRELGQPHPLMIENKIDAVPLRHEKMDAWRDSLRRGVEFHHEATNLLVCGGVDDVWLSSRGEYIVVDYKSTSTRKEITLEDEWKVAYKRQMEIYQWLFRQNGFKVSPTGYFVYCNGFSDRPRFDARLEFNIIILPYTGNDGWVEGTLREIKKCLDSESIPDPAEDCEVCQFVRDMAEV